MQPVNVVLLQGDPGIAQFLTTPLRNFFRSVREARSFSDLRTSVARHRAEVIILDLEMASTRELELLCHDFPAIRVVCNHRVADEAMWADCLTAGAVDCYPSHDTQGILTAALRNAPMTHSLVA